MKAFTIDVCPFLFSPMCSKPQIGKGNLFIFDDVIVRVNSGLCSGISKFTLYITEMQQLN